MGSLFLAVFAPVGGGWTQEEVPPAGQEVSPAGQIVIDADALVVAVDVTTRCALFDSTVAYLTPLEQAAATLRLREMTETLPDLIEDAPDAIARMHAEAAAIDCGNANLVPFMDFGRQVARDVIDIALVAWRTIDIEPCHYFADDDFLRAVARAHAAAPEWVVEGPENRVAFIEQRAAAWISLFAGNCTNSAFDPVQTVPGQIALALPQQ